MKRLKFIVPVVALAVATMLAFGNARTAFAKEKQGIKPLATTYFVFNGATPSQYSDSTQWMAYPSDPGPSCPGGTVTCLLSSVTHATRTQLVNAIKSNGGNIPSSANILQKKS